MKSCKVKFHVRSGDEVVVIAGGAKGRRGTIKRVIPSTLSVIIEGNDNRSKGIDEQSKILKEKGASNHILEKRRLLKPQLHYIKKNQNNPNGGLLWLEGPIHVSNVMKLEDYQNRRNSGQNRN